MRSSTRSPYFPRHTRWDRATGEPGVFSPGLRLHGTRPTPAPTTRRQSVSSVLSEICHNLLAKKLFKPRNIVYLVISCATFVMLATASLSKRPLTPIHLQPLDIELSKMSHSTPRDIYPTPPLADGCNQSVSESSTEFTANGTRNSNSSSSKSLVEQTSASSNHKAVTTGAEPRRIVLLVTNQGFLDFTDNLLRSIEKSGCHPNITIVAEDQASFQNLSSRQDGGPLVIKPPDFNSRPQEQDALDFGVVDYVKFINRRPKYVLDFIQRGFEVFFVDSDAYWFKDPSPYFQGDFDVAYAKDSPHDFNAGVGYYKPTPNTVKFLEFWIQQMTAQAKSKKPKADQDVMKMIIRSKHIRNLRVKGLNQESFPCAKHFSKTNECDNYTSESAVFHAAYLPGHDKKKAMFQQCNLWLL
ncbi:uncharacterized protein LOC119719299 [Patiria miniata]|uniref:Nucleotide-diphospho-sugar transferase domain-containing protein n=1 Tax=Patiria miniata TaxID=46514 RepID=A0A913Z0V9_PATMI|nr:uncharacterized protein LOC119719299 [Patiria miniata]